MASPVEKVSLAALQILQCICSIRTGQELVLSSKPELLHEVCKAAVDSDEEREGLQHAALMVLTQWASDIDSPLPKWLNSHPPPPAAGVTNGLQHLPQAAASAPALVHVALASILHPVLAVRKAAAHLFAATAAATAVEGGPASQGGAPASVHAGVVAAAAHLAAEAVQVLVAEEAATALPRFEVFANGNSRVMLDPLAFMNHQHAMAKQKTTCQALLQLVSELCLFGTPGIAVLAACPQLVQAAAQVFASAWAVSWQGHGQAASHQHVVTSAHMAALTAPFAFIADHQSRELALDCLVHLVSKPGGAPLLAPSLVQQQQQQQVGGAGSSPLTPAHEQEALAQLLQLAQDLLQQPSAGHVRAALTLLGHVKFQSPAAGQAAATSSSAAAAQASVHVRWMQLLCDVFDSAWEADQRDGSEGGAQQAAAGQLPPQLPASLLQFPQSPANPPAPGPSQQAGTSQQPPKLQLELGLGYRVLVQVLQAWKHLVDAQCPAAAQAMDHTQWRGRVERAVSHPKHLVAAAAAKLMLYGGQQQAGAEAGAGPGSQRPDDMWSSLGLVAPTAAGPSGAASSAPAAPPANTAGSWGQGAFEAAVAAMGLGDGAVAAASGSVDAEMQEFLNVFLGEGADDGELAGSAAAASDGPAQPAASVDAAPLVSMGDLQGPDAAAGSSLPPVDMFAGWAGGDAAGDEVLAEALSLLPDLDQVAANTCAKYESVPGFFPPGF